jgi:Spy/CpxP family protein refolding chaperone
MTQQAKQILAALLIGCLIGIVAGARFEKSAYHRFWKTGPDSERLVKKLGKDLGLDDKQREAIKAIVDKRQVQVVALHQEVDGKFGALRDGMNAEIRAALTPDQQKKFDDLVAKWNAKRHRDESKPGEKGPPIEGTGRGG